MTRDMRHVSHQHCSWRPSGHGGVILLGGYYEPRTSEIVRYDGSGEAKYQLIADTV